MKKLTILAALLLASTSAYAGNSVSFEISGHKVHIAVPKNCDQLSCVTISATGFSDFNLKDLKLGSSPSDDNDAPAPNTAAQNSASATVNQPPATSQQTSDLVGAPPALVTMAPTPAATAPIVTNGTAAPAPEAVTSIAPPAAAKVETPVAAPAAAPATPLGVWETEGNKGKVRIEACGSNLCGYAVKSKPGENGEKILINMKPSDAKWVGRIYDPDSGRNYDSNIAMKGSNRLRVEGCAFGGMLCGGQTWTRVS